MTNETERFIRLSIEIAARSRAKGNHPFGALLVGADGSILLEAENTVTTENDCTCHAELNLVRMASNQFSPDVLATCTLYTSTEPCAMCAGAIYWSNVGRVVFGISAEGLYDLSDPDEEHGLYLPCRDVFAKGQKTIEVVGPVLVDEARKVHEGFWN